MGTLTEQVHPETCKKTPLIPRTAGKGGSMAMLTRLLVSFPAKGRNGEVGEEAVV